MRKTWAALAALLLLLWVVNKAAYRGYFSGDELDLFAWMRSTTWDTFAIGLVTPEFYAHNFRPVGHFVYWALFHTVAYDYRWYIGVLHLLHMVNLLLLWRLLPFGFGARVCGVVFFAFHIACFDDYWRSMTLFDVLCTTFCLGSLIAWARGRWVWSLVLFWFAYKTKELAIALPVILLLYELWLGEKRWRKLTPFFAISFLFGIQAVLTQGGKEGVYGLRLTPGLVAQAMDFYASHVLLVPHLGFGLLLVPFVVRDRRVWWGIAGFVLFLAPMLLIPNRLLSSYLYLPLVGLAYALAAIAERFSWRWVAPGLAVWLWLNYQQLPPLRRTLLAQAEETRVYFAAVMDLAKRQPELRTFVLDGDPPHLMVWGVVATLRLAFGTDEIETLYVEDMRTRVPKANAPLALLSWDPPAQRLYTMARIDGQRDGAWIEMSRLTPVWQLEQGWYPRDATFRWTEPYARARLWRPETAKEFAVDVNIGPDYLKMIGEVTLETKLNGVTMGRETFRKSGWQTVRYALKPGAGETVKVEFVVTPPLRSPGGDNRLLGIPLGAFGFR